jgi:hypothetical protein
MIDNVFLHGFLFVFPSSKLAQYEQDLKHLHHELRSKEVFLTKVKFFLGKLLNLKKNSKLLVTI